MKDSGDEIGQLKELLKSHCDNLSAACVSLAKHFADDELQDPMMPEIAPYINRLIEELNQAKKGK